jgi:hypothetical protein
VVAAAQATATAPLAPPLPVATDPPTLQGPGIELCQKSNYDSVNSTCNMLDTTYTVDQATNAQLVIHAPNGQTFPHDKLTFHFTLANQNTAMADILPTVGTTVFSIGMDQPSLTYQLSDILQSAVGGSIGPWELVDYTMEVDCGDTIIGKTSFNVI